MRVPFNKPAFIGQELEAVRKAILENQHISGVGPYTQYCEEWLQRRYSAPVLLVSSCTHALEISALLLNLSETDEIILPSYTFVSTANAFALRNCRLRFADCDENGQLSLDAVERVLTSKTKAVCVVHYGGFSTDMPKLKAFCDTHGLYLIEDAAQAIDAYYREGETNHPLGTYGDLACISFHETKNITSGEGGALVINRPDLLDRALILREKGTNRAQFFQGLVDKYTWVDIGSSYVLSEMNAAYLSVQLDYLSEIQARRREIWERYSTAIRPLADALGVRIIEPPSEMAAGRKQNHHLFGFVFLRPNQSDSTRALNARMAFIQFMKERGVTTPFHYVSLHESPMGRHYPTEGRLKNTETLSAGLVRLPLYYNMTPDEQEYVISSVQTYAQQVGCYA